MKNWLLGITLSLIAVFAPIKPLLLSVGFLLFADTVSGVLAARKRGEKISSSKFRTTIVKALVYNLCIMSGFAMENFILEGAMPVAKIIAGAIGVCELKSLLENANEITGMDVFQEIKKKLASPNIKD